MRFGEEVKEPGSSHIAPTSAVGDSRDISVFVS